MKNEDLHEAEPLDALLAALDGKDLAAMLEALEHEEPSLRELLKTLDPERSET